MKKLSAFWKRLPRLLRSAIYILLSFLTILAIYTFLGAPIYSLEGQFRRAERAHMVGPGTILGTVDLEADLDSYRKMLLADAGEGIIFYCYDHVRYDPPELVYREKTGDITVLCAPYPNENRELQTTAWLPVLVFDKCPEAVRAELELTVSISHRGRPFEKTYFLTAQRENLGYFLLRLTAHDSRGLALEGTALQRLVMVSGYHGGTYSDLEIPVLVRLYGADGVLLQQTETAIRSIPVMTREEIEDLSE